MLMGVRVTICFAQDLLEFVYFMKVFIQSSKVLFFSKVTLNFIVKVQETNFMAKCQKLITKNFEQNKESLIDYLFTEYENDQGIETMSYLLWT